jgi:hypothetical protein
MHRRVGAKRAACRPYLLATAHRQHVTYGGPALPARTPPARVSSAADRAQRQERRTLGR